MTDYTELLRDKSTWASGWQTRDGRPVRILANDLKSDMPIVAAVNEGMGEYVSNHRANGSWAPLTGYEHPRDLVPRPVKRKGWVNIGRHGHTLFYDSRIEADEKGWPDRIACIEIEFFEGEGLGDKP